MYLLRERLTQNDKCKFLLVKDNLKRSGTTILDTIATSLRNESANLSYLSYERPLSNVNHLLSENVKIIDAFSDPFSWRNTQDCNLVSSNVFNNLSVPNSIFVIDSLSTLLIHNSAKALYQSIHKFLKTGSQLIAALHSDAHSEKDFLLLEMLATTVLELLPIDETDYFIRCTVKYPSGKVLQQDLIFQINNCHEITSIKNAPSLTNIQIPAKRPDPTANLTFNLNLKSVEKEVRDKLPLPYVKVTEDDSANVTSVPFDEDDFYDEEDPDDDLDF